MIAVINSGNDSSYDHLFEGFTLIHEDSADSPYIPWEDVTVVLLVGDVTDVDPNLYGEVPVPECGTVNRTQDLEAFRFMDHAFANGIPVIGICKGAQQVCVYSDGKLRQHVPQVGTHEVGDTDGNTYMVEADHHQVMVPPDEATVEVVNNSHGYPEFVWQDDVFGTWGAFQYHPEWCESDSEARNVFNLWRDYVCGP